MCMQVTQRPGQDNLAMNAIRFLTTVAKSVHSKLFADPAALKQICEAIILPNLRVRPGCVWVGWGGVV
jgi:exportin-2 (importin alpha re-exporter)